MQLPSLAEQGIEQLYPSPHAADQEKRERPGSPSLNHAYYLLKISKSLLLNFLEFIGILSIDPEQFESKLADLHNLFINAHHLLNLYRPHQARESLILMMEEQLDRTRDEIDEIDRTKLRIESLLQRLRADGAEAASAALPPPPPPPSVPQGSSLQDDSTEQARQVWALINDGHE
jgi:mediator of RNA polymerase II transcription subunit 7